MYHRAKECNTRISEVAPKVLLVVRFGAGSHEFCAGTKCTNTTWIDYGAEVAFKFTLSSSLYQWNARVMVYTPTPNFWCDLKGFGEFIKSWVIVKLAYFG